MNQSIHNKASRTVKIVDSLRLLLPTCTHKRTQGLISGNGKLEKDHLLCLFFPAPNPQGSTFTLVFYALSFSKCRADRQYLFYPNKRQLSNGMISNTWIILYIASQIMYATFSHISACSLCLC